MSILFRLRSPNADRCEQSRDQQAPLACESPPNCFATTMCWTSGPFVAVRLDGLLQTGRVGRMGMICGFAGSPCGTARTENHGKPKKRVVAAQSTHDGSRVYARPSSQEIPAGKPLSLSACQTDCRAHPAGQQRRLSLRIATIPLMRTGSRSWRRRLRPHRSA